MTTDNAVPTDLSDPPPQDPAQTDPPIDPPALSDPPADDPPTDPNDPPRPRSQERIEELVAQNKAEREAMAEYAEFWRQRALASATPPAETSAPAEQPDPAPALDQYDSTEKWASAYSAWTERQIEKRTAAAVDQRLSQTREQESQETTRSTYYSRLSEFQQSTPDAVVTIGNPAMTAALQRQPVIGEVVMASEVGPALAYHLARNPGELARITKLTPTQAAAAVGRIEAKLAAAAPTPSGGTPPKPKAPVPSNAPPPPTPIDGGGAPSVDLSKCSMDEYLDIRLGRKRR